LALAKAAPPDAFPRAPNAANSKTAHALKPKQRATTPDHFMPDPKDTNSRRDFLKDGVRGALLFTLGMSTTALARRSENTKLIWQINPAQCVQCGNCATHCVLEESAVKCVQLNTLCGYCKLCTGYFDPQPAALDTGAENQLCPTGAIQRKALEDPYYEYTIDEPRCIGCGKCVRGCVQFGNGSFHLQIRHDRCLNCNECSIAFHCPANAIHRVPASEPYLLNRNETPKFA
jgi:electron transport complex protein RnfB